MSPLTNAEFGDDADRPDADRNKGVTWVSDDTGDVYLSDGTQWILLGTAGAGGPTPLATPMVSKLANFNALVTDRTYVLLNSGLTATLPVGPPDGTTLKFKDYYTGGLGTIAAGAGDTIEQGATYPLNNADSVEVTYFAGNTNWMVM